MKPDIQKFLALKTAIVNEKTRLEARLAEISKVLGGAVSVAASSPAPAAPTTTTPGKRTFSAATKAKMRAAQKARWAKIKGKSAFDAAPAAPVAKKKRKKTKMSAEGRAAIVAAQKARWAKIKTKHTAKAVSK